MQYLVNTCGEISQTKTKSYIVDAKSESEAEVIAKKMFVNDYSVIDENIIYSKTYDKDRTKKVILACILMFVAVVISCWTWNVDFFWSFVKPKKISVAPNMISCILSCLFFSSYVVRFKGIRRTVAAKTDIILSILIILLISSFLQIILTANNLRLLGIIPLNFMNPEVLLIVGVILSWLGMKFLSVVIFALIALMAVSNVIQLSDAMGLWGVVYVMCAFMGILMWLSVEPCIMEAMPKFKNDLLRGYSKIKHDIAETKEEIKNIRESLK